MPLVGREVLDHSGSVGEREFDTRREVAQVGTEYIARATVGGDGERGCRFGFGLDVVPVAGEVFAGEQVDIQTAARLDDGEGEEGIVEPAQTAGALGDIRLGDGGRRLLGQPVVAGRELAKGDGGRSAAGARRGHGAATSGGERFEGKRDIVGTEIAFGDQGLVGIDWIVVGVAGVDIERKGAEASCALWRAYRRGRW